MQPPAAANVSPSRIRAIATLADQYPGTLRLFVGEDTLPTPDFIKDAANLAIAANKTYYTPNAGYLEVRETIAQHLQDLHGVDIDPTKQIIVTSGGMNAIVLAYQATLGPGTSAIIISPIWPNITAGIRVTGADAIEVPLQFHREGYRLDFEHLEHAVRPDTRLLAVASPGNPTGWMASKDDWQKLGEFCQRHDLWLLADAAYERIVLEGRAAPSAFSIPEVASRLIVVQTFSKAYRMTGWRIGYVVAPPELGRTMANLQEYVVSNAPGIMQEAARAAIVGGEPMIAEAQRRYAKHMQITTDHLTKMEGVVVPKPAGAFYVFPRLEGLTDSFRFCEWLVTKHGVGLAPGGAFGEGGEGHIRLCFAVEEPILREALDRFETGWKEYHER